MMVVILIIIIVMMDTRTSVVPVVLSASTTSVTAILSVGCPVGHTAQLVALGEGSVGDAIEGGLGGDCWSPSVTIGQRRDEVGNGGRHDVKDVLICQNIVSCK